MASIIEIGRLHIVSHRAGKQIPDGWAELTVTPLYDSEGNCISVPLNTAPYLRNPTDTELLAKAQDETKRVIKTEAEQRILEAIPAWKQRNLTAHSVTLAFGIIELMLPHMPEVVQTEAAAAVTKLKALQALKEQSVDSVRTASDAAEADVDTKKTAVEVKAYDARGW